MNDPIDQYMAFLDAQEAQEEEIELRQATRLARLREALEDYNRMYHLITRYME